MPIGACVTGPEAAGVLEAGDHGSTFAGGPVACAAALAVLEIVDDPALLRRVRELGAKLGGELEGIEGVKEVRGRGLMLGVGLEDGLDAAALRDELLGEGLVVNAPEPNTIRLLPPLVIGDAEVEKALQAFGQSCNRLLAAA
jgi:acetylornithine aminotransferase